MMPYRTYDAQWNRTGYAAAPQYAGQASQTDDYPATCHCGATMKGCGDAAWLVGRGYDVPAWVADGYVAWCHNGHEMKKAAIV